MTDVKHEQDLKLRDDKINKLKALVIKEKKINAECHEKLNKTQKELNLVKEENKTLSSQIERLCQSIGEVQNNQTSETDFTEKISSLEKLLSEKDNALKELEEKYLKSEDCVKDLTSKTDTEINALKDHFNFEKENLLSQSFKDRETIESLKSVNSELHEAMKSIEEKLSENSQQFDSKLKESALLINDLERKLNENNDQTSNIKCLEDEKCRLIESQKDLTDQISALQMMYQSSQCLADNLKNELETKNEKLKALDDVKSDEKSTQTIGTIVQELFSSQETDNNSENLQLSSELLSDFEFLLEFLKTVTETGSVDRSQLPENLQSYPSLSVFLDSLEKVFIEKVNLGEVNETLQDGMQSLSRKCEQLEEVLEKTEETKSSLQTKIERLEGDLVERTDSSEVVNLCKSLSLICESIMVNSSDLDLQLIDISPEIRSLQEFSNILEKVRYLSTQLKEHLVKINTLEMEVESSFGKRDHIQVCLEDCQKLNADLTAQLENERFAHVDTQRNMDLLTEKLNRMQSESVISAENELVQKFEQLERNLVAKTIQVQSMESIVEDNRNIARALENEKDALQQEMVEMRTRTEEKEAFLEEESKEIKAKLDQINERYNEDIENRDNEIESLKKERQILQQEIDLLQVEIDRKDFDIKELSNDRETLTESLSSLKVEKEELETKLNKSISELKHELEIKECNLQSLSQTMDEYKKIETESLQKREAENQMSSNSEILQLKDDLSQLNETLKIKDNTIAELQCLKDLQTDQSAKEKEILNCMKQELETLQTRNSELEANLEDLQNQLETNANQLQSTLNEKEKLLNERSEELSHLQTENQSLLSRIETLDKECKTMKASERTAEQSSGIKDMETKCSKLESQIALHEATISNLKAELESQCSNVETLSYDKAKLETSCANERANFQDDITRLKELLNAKEKSILILQEELGNALKSARQNSVMDLELAEFEKMVSSYKDQLTAQEKELAALNEEISRKDSQLNSYRQQLKDNDSLKKQSDERANKLKQMLVKTKKELSELQKSSVQFQDTDNRRNEEIESLTSQFELSKLQYSEVSTKLQKLEDKLTQSKTVYESKLKSSNSLVATLKEDLSLMKEDRDSLKKEFDAYKQKVHKAFKESKPKTSVNQISVSEAQAQNERLESAIEKLKQKLEDVEDQLAAAKCEAELSQREYDRWIDKYHKLEEAYQQQEQHWQERYDRLSVENNYHENESLTTIQQLSTENESISDAFREQIKSIKEEHKETVSSLRAELEASESEVLKLQEENWALREQRNQLKLSLSSNNQQNVNSRNGPSTGYSQSLNAISQTTISTVTSLQERQQGEGMENPEQEHLSSVVASSGSTPRLSDQSASQTIRDNFYSKSTGRHIIPLDQLLDSSNRDDVEQDDIDNSISSSQTISLAKHEQMIGALTSDVTSKSKQITHLTDLLNDSEAMVVRLTDQAKVLKDEIRRYEKNDERSTVLKNSETTEYLKNIILKFLSLNPGDERMQLVPVITTLLSLTVEEKNLLIQVAQIHHDQSAEAQGWANYFSWTGLS